MDLRQDQMSMNLKAVRCNCFGERPGALRHQGTVLEDVPVAVELRASGPGETVEDSERPAPAGLSQITRFVALDQGLAGGFLPPVAT